ncbi:hypothetical protein ZOSMA_20G00380 [Zostera marina]|uniref:RRM domain-containing protein n=1 Tax=Zostera marina TaxID=29655 RepID=A0A0K9PMV7_ZOSMR|nr:hypothetical protein ZOSMA_20G00380 [Zostera marina]
MSDPYRRFSMKELDSRASFPGYSDGYAGDRLPSNFLQTSTVRSGAYNFTDLAAIGNRATTEIGGIPSASTTLISNHLAVGAGTDRGIPSLHDPALVRKETPLAAISSGADIERPISVANSVSLHGDECSVLYIDGLPTDCTRREVGHLFRPFIGFKNIRLYHKEPRQSEDKARVLCFVEFEDAKCATIALDALQGYKFDDKKTNAPILKIHFAHFPIRLPS